MPHEPLVCLNFFVCAGQNSLYLSRVFQSAQTHFMLLPKTWSHFYLFWETMVFWLHSFSEISNNCFYIVLIIFWPLLSFVRTSIICSSLIADISSTFLSWETSFLCWYLPAHGQYFWYARLFSLEGEIGDRYFYNAIMFSHGELRETCSNGLGVSVLGRNVMFLLYRCFLWHFLPAICCFCEDTYRSAKT